MPMKFLLDFEPGSASGVGCTAGVSSSIVVDEFCKPCKSVGSDTDVAIKVASSASGWSKDVHSSGGFPSAPSEAPIRPEESCGEDIATASNVAKLKVRPQLEIEARYK